MCIQTRKFRNSRVNKSCVAALAACTKWQPKQLVCQNKKKRKTSRSLAPDPFSPRRVKSERYESGGQKQMSDNENSNIFIILTSFIYVKRQKLCTNAQD